ncbi:MAG TPA: hypothetical protein VFU80_08050 [Sphingomicrobium sp.]|nr:hypothetical protein [Sphingomicrobium sp.]
MRSAAIVGAAAAIAVSGCDDGQPPQQRPIHVRSAAQDQLHELNDLNRAIGLKRAIFDSGYRCGRITRSGFAGTYKNLDMWMASCDDGRDWAIFVGPDGSAQVRDCKDVKGLGLPECAITGSEGAERAAG